MSDSSTRIKFCFEVHPFESDYYSFQADFSNFVHRVEMTSNSSLNDISLFIGSLLAFNESSLDSEFVAALSKKEELALVGGLLFEQNHLTISPSCCADFQDWFMVVDEIKKGASPWMGHDPDPWFEFDSENIILWNDEPEVEEIYCIRLTQQEFDQQLLRAKQELYCFCEKIEVLGRNNYQADPNLLASGMKNYLFVNLPG